MDNEAGVSVRLSGFRVLARRLDFELTMKGCSSSAEFHHRQSIYQRIPAGLRCYPGGTRAQHGYPCVQPLYVIGGIRFSGAVAHLHSCPG
jgi:hypothetical protein